MKRILALLIQGRSTLCVWFVGLLVTATPLKAADFAATWDGSSGNWNDGTRWSTSPNFPNNAASTYDAIINGGSISLNQNITIEKLTISSGILSGVSGNTLTANDLFLWTGGTLIGDGSILASGGLTISGIDGKLLAGSWALTNNGAANFSGANISAATSASAAPGPQIVNNGFFTATDDADITQSNQGGGFAPSFQNTASGTLTKTGAGTNTNIAIALHNNGLLNVSSGVLQLTNGGTSGGTFYVGSPGSLAFGNGLHTLTAASNVSGAGSVNFSLSGQTNIGGGYNPSGATNITDGASANFNSAAASGSGSLSLNGVLGGSGQLAVSGPFAWNGGQMNGTGNLILNGGLTISGIDGKILAGSRVLTNNGTSTFSGANIIAATSASAAPGATIVNNGTFIATDDADIVQSNIFGLAPSFHNTATGTFTKTGAGTSTNIAIKFDNDGIVNANSGTLQLTNGGTSGGTFSSAALASLAFGNGLHTLTAASAVSGAGSVNFVLGGQSNIGGGYSPSGATNITDGATANFNTAAATSGSGNLSGGTLAGSGQLAVSGPFAWTGGRMAGTGGLSTNGGLTISGAVGKTIAGSRVLTNNGTATFSGANIVAETSASAAPGAMIVNNGQFSVTDEADIVQSYIFGNLPSVHNTATGTFTKTGAGTTTAIGIDFQNGGTVNVDSGTLHLANGGRNDGIINVNGGELALTGVVNAGTINMNNTVEADMNLPLNGTSLVNNLGATINLNGPGDLNNDSMASARTIIGGNVTNNGKLSARTNAKIVGSLTTAVTAETIISPAAPCCGMIVEVTGGVINGGTFTMRTDSAAPCCGLTLDMDPGQTFTNNATGVVNLDGQENIGGAQTIESKHTIDGSVDNRGQLNIRTNAKIAGSLTTAVNAETVVSPAAPCCGTTVEVAGPITNNGTMSIMAPMGASPTVEFTLDVAEDFTNNGEVNMGSQEASANGATVRVATGRRFRNNPSGILKARGRIRGGVLNKGRIRPGNSPGTLEVEGDYSQEATGILEMELASATSSDKLDITGDLALNGALVVLLVNGYVPYGSQAFDILDWDGTLTGAFSSIDLPTQGGTLTWDTSLLYTTGVLSVVGPTLTGDYNQNGLVDAADYVVWRKDPNRTQPQYDAWRAHFGPPAGSGSNLAGASPSQAAVPESSSALLLILGAALGTLKGRRMGSRAPSTC